MKNTILQYTTGRMTLEVKLENLSSVKVLKENKIILSSKDGGTIHYGFPNSKEKYAYIEECKSRGIVIDYSQL